MCLHYNLSTKRVQSLHNSHCRGKISKITEQK
ncbi:hypothetical protein Godav_020558 [Gossypium davidsonii]|uniref:Uncharacterized protein n=1 Tax=Gossypium davidsonii TaxID=34287 RepID=A0A7J8R4L4_GOSDV|nr:hypothetical protein [Gossypium davidsonii]